MAENSIADDGDEMKTYVNINFSLQEITVDYDPQVLSFDKTLLTDLPEKVNPDDFDEIVWHESDKNKRFIALKTGEAYLYDSGKYDSWISPYVALWKSKKEQQQKEKDEAEAEWNKFENKKARALEELNRAFDLAADGAHLSSSLGFDIDANSTANENVNGLLITIGDSAVDFCDYHNEFHELNKTQLETLRTEIIKNGQNLYAQKWGYRTAIENSENEEQLNKAVSDIDFLYLDFSSTDETKDA